MSNFQKNFEQALINAKRLTDKILIDGKLVSAQSKNKIPVLNPSTGDNIGSAPQCNKAVSYTHLTLPTIVSV